MLIIALIILIALAIMVVMVDKLLKAVVLTAVFSVVASFVYLVLGAPDVALAETVIGSTLSTIILLIAIKRCKLFTIYYVLEDKSRTNELSNKVMLKVLSIIDTALKEHEIEPHTICSVESVEVLQQEKNYDIIVEQKQNEIVIHGKENSFNTKSIVQNINNENLRYRVRIEDDTDKKVYNYKDSKDKIMK